MSQPDKPVIFFDGLCGLCSRFVDFALPRDRQERFYFAPLQGKTAKELLPEAAITDLDSIALWQNGQVFYRSTAVLKVTSRLSGPLGWLSKLAWVVPAFLRDFVYRQIAHNRYQVFGKKDLCRVPTAEERRRFLD